MNNEETTLDPQYTAKPQAKTSAGVNPAKPEKKKSSDRGENATYAAVGVAGGAVAGAAIGVAATASGQTFAANAQPANAEGAEEARADSKTATATDDSATTGGGSHRFTPSHSRSSNGKTRRFSRSGRSHHCHCRRSARGTSE